MTEKRLYLCVTPFFPSPEAWQGAYVLDQVKAIARNSEYEVIVFKPTTMRDKRKSYEVDGVTVHLFPTLQTPSYLFNGFFNDYNGRSFVRKVQELGIDLGRVRFVHTHTGPFAVYGLALRKIAPHIKVFVQHHDLDPFTIRNGRLAHWRPNARYRARNSIRLFNEVDLHICISTPVKDSLLAFPKARKEEVDDLYLKRLQTVNELPHIQSKVLTILYNGVDTALFNSEGRKRRSDIFRIGCIANFWDMKDHHTLVEAFRILIEKGYFDMRLSLLGSGPLKEVIEAYLKSNGLWQYVEWPSEVHHKQLPDYYRTLDLFVLPSYYEGFGCVYTEAYACNVPFIACQSQGIAECVEPEERSLWLVEPKNPEQLAKCIEKYYIERREQHLCVPYDINELIKGFMETIERL